jgi:hypothetical protein
MTVSYLEGRKLKRVSLTTARIYCMKNDAPRRNVYECCGSKYVWFNYFRILNEHMHKHNAIRKGFGK